MGQLLPCTCLPGLVGARDPREGRGRISGLHWSECPKRRGHSEQQSKLQLPPFPHSELFAAVFLKGY